MAPVTSESTDDTDYDFVRDRVVLAQKVLFAVVILGIVFMIYKAVKRSDADKRMLAKSMV